MTFRVLEICKCADFFFDLDNRPQIRENDAYFLIQQKFPVPLDEPKQRRKCCRKKKKIPDAPVDVEDAGNFFGVPLEKLTPETVTLMTGFEVAVPKVLHELCEYVLANVDEEGVFRKQGCNARQARVKAEIEAQGKLPADPVPDVIDVAVIIKYFLRRLPRPLIPEEYHELFLACEESSDKEDFIPLSCLLLLTEEQLALLIYMMQFFKKVASHSEKNEMTPYNLAVCVAPSIMPVSKEEDVPRSVTVVRILIEQAELLGTVPDYIKKMTPPKKKTCWQKFANKFGGRK
ncbi:hypothetical protein JTB14_035109 [Gonioctena quinquepunctata]|nr:hypothetical protein JTB14_035109 [Gonioctena quinquepunctata]